MPQDITEEQETVGYEEEGMEESPDTSELIKNSLSELATILSENPEIDHRVREVFDYHLKEGVDSTTWTEIWNALEILLPEGTVEGIVNSCRFNDNEFFDFIKEETEGIAVDKVIPFLQHLTALYGNEMKEAYDLSGEIPDDWRSSAITLYRIEEGKVWLIDADLTKYDGENVFLKMPIRSAFILLQRLAMEMEKIPRDDVDEEVITAFREGTEGFKKKFLSDNGGRD